MTEKEKEILELYEYEYSKFTILRLHLKLEIADEELEKIKKNSITFEKINEIRKYIHEKEDDFNEYNRLFQQVILYIEKTGKIENYKKFVDKNIVDKNRKVAKTGISKSVLKFESEEKCLK